MSSANTYRAVVTGASGGIGEHIALALAPSCTTLLLVGRNSDKLAAVRDTINTRHPTVAVQLVSADLSTQDGRDALLAAAHTVTGGINLLANIAGISEFHSFESQDARRIEQLVATNLTSPMLVCQQLLPLLLKQRSAQIINVGSVFGDIGFPGFAAYCASKFGLRGFSQALRRELADTPVRVRYFAPRATRTPINSSTVDAMNAELKTHVDDPAAVAEAFMRFLAGNKSEAVLGWPERFFVFINRLRPSITDGALGKQLPVIQRHLPR